mmetsp:Transcript_24425/g.51843  ORF Transcript_24425/g.51843 Transcript_24425/m.51843 type:complete len:94 (+) Transcript_24425:1498-1779(+)
MLLFSELMPNITIATIISMSQSSFFAHIMFSLRPEIAKFSLHQKFDPIFQLFPNEWYQWICQHAMCKPDQERRDGQKHCSTNDRKGFSVSPIA